MKIKNVIVEKLPESCMDCYLRSDIGWSQTRVMIFTDCLATRKFFAWEELNPCRPDWCPLTTLKDLIYDLGWEGDD